MSELNGIILINKPQDFTSFDVAAIMRRCAGTRKIGHGGTLDPMATGVLPIFIGRATKVADLVPVDVKSYRAGFKFGTATDTEDIWGTVIKTEDANVSFQSLSEAVSSMVGDYMQTPPMYSAVKVDGKKLYELARKGIEIERKARLVRIDEIRIVSYDEKLREGVMDVTCSKGTYIRTLITDIASKLGTIGIMTSLIRTSSAGFSLSQCCELEEIRNLTPESLEKKLLPTESVFNIFDRVVLDDVQRRLFLNGVTLDTERMNISYPAGTWLRISDIQETFLGVAVVDEEKGLKVRYLNVLR